MTRGFRGESMHRSLEEIKAGLVALSPSDFDIQRVEITGPARLNQLCNEIEALEVAEPVFEALFSTLERLDGCDLGSPGPIVHALEAMPGYEQFLNISVSRKPTPLTVWMINRAMNGDPADDVKWIQLLKQTLTHTKASATVKEEAAEFLEFQSQQ